MGKTGNASSKWNRKPSSSKQLSSGNKNRKRQWTHCRGKGRP